MEEVGHRLKVWMAEMKQLTALEAEVRRAQMCQDWPNCRCS
jgi:hypothetical protein